MDENALDIDKTLQALTIKEKLRMLTGDGLWHTFAVADLPRVRMSDGPNGLRMTEGALGTAVPATCYPTASMLANSWDPALCFNVGAAMGREATALGVNVILAPGVNIKRTPVGGRNFEYYSEDPLLSGTLGKAFVLGVQSTGVGACVKHFAANNHETMRMYSDSVIDPRALHELYLKPFELALEARPAAVMCAYNKVNGEYCSENAYLLKTVLRGQFGYDGLTLSDWGAVRDRAKALRAGLDLEMPDSLGIFKENLERGLADGIINEDDVDCALRRLLELTDAVYLEPYGDYDEDDHDRLSYNAAVDSLVMLKNDNNFLPLTKAMRIAVIGELAETAPIQGGGSSHVTPFKTLSPLEAFKKRGIPVSYYRGYSSDKREQVKLFDEALSGAVNADAVIVFVGTSTPREGIDRATLQLPEEQNRLIGALTNAGHRVVVVLCSAGPCYMDWIKRVRSVIYAGLNGQNGALAAVDALFGRINPRGRLAETFPVDGIFTEGDELGRQVLYRESLFVGYKFYDAIKRRALFPFGHGLSFSEITYDDMHVRRLSGDSFEVAVTLSNRSTRDAYEVVQIYVEDRTGKVMRPPKTLAGFCKVFVEGQTTSIATVRLDRRAFEFWNEAQGRFCVPDGEFRILAAASAADVRKEMSVKVTGDFTDVLPYPQCYDTPLHANISDADFLSLFAAPPPEPAPLPQKGEYTLDNCLGDFHGLLARIMRAAIRRRAKKEGGTDPMIAESFTASALYTPLSAVASMSDGAITPNLARAIVAFENGKFFTALKLVIKRNEKVNYQE